MTQTLQGVNALVTRPAGQAAALCEAIRAAGGSAVSVPMLEIHPFTPDDPEHAAIEQLFARLEEFDLAIFISTNAVRAARAQLRRRHRAWPARAACLAIGAATAAALERAGITAAGGSGAMNSEELLASERLGNVLGQRILILKGTGGREALARELTARGARVETCALYRRDAPRTTPAELAALLARHAINVVLLGSGEALANLVGLLGAAAAGTMAPVLALVVPSGRVAQLARAQGFALLEIAANATDREMLAALGRLAARLRAGSQPT